MYPITRIKALYRFTVFRLLRHRVTRWDYDNPENVMGYQGGYSIGKRILAFVRPNGSLQFFW